MTKSIRIPTPIELKNLTRVMQIRGVDVFIHWSVFLVAAIMLANVIKRPLVTLVGLTSYLGVLLIHEAGHLIAAQKLHCQVFSIELYPVFGLTHFQTTWSRFDHCVIAWGGVIAQATVAVPIIIWLKVAGFTSSEPMNAFLAILGPISLAIAAFNLLPLGRLDGAIAWKLIPEFFRRQQNSRSKYLR
jgi:stage IV sporulation protein FB